MIYKIKIKRSSESTYFVNLLNLVNNYNNTKLKKKVTVVIIFIFSFFMLYFYISNNVHRICQIIC